MKYFYEDEWRELPGALTPVVDNLDSTDTKSALSANQGKVLNDKIQNIKETDPTVPTFVKNISQEDITKWNDKSYSSLTGVPTKLGDFTNDQNFIDNTVSNLVNYYSKTDSYNKSEIDGMIKGITTIDIKVVSALPSSEISTHTIYLVPKGTPVAAAASTIEGPDFEGSMKQDKLIIGSSTIVEGAQSDAPMAIAAANNSYDEYIYVSEKWEMIGSTEVDLSGYLTKEEASTTYLRQDTASSTYLDKNTATSTYLTQANAALTYLKAEQADSEEDALAKSAQNPNVLYYWSE